MSGRGNLLHLFKKNVGSSEISFSSGEQTKDSGLDPDHSLSSDDYRGEINNINLSVHKPKFSIDGAQNVLSHKSLNTAHLMKNASNSENLSEAETNKVGNIRNTHITFCDDDDEMSIKNNLFYPTTTSGSKGSSVNLSSNYIRLESDPNKGVYVYEVRFNPSIDSVHLRMKYLNEHKEKIGGTTTFDGTTLYLPIKLENELTTFLSKSINNTEIELRILFKKKESLKNCIQLYNILFDRVMRTLNFVKFDRKQFDPSNPKVIPSAKLEVWPGYVTAVDEFDGGLMLCCDVSHRLLSQKTVLEMLIEIYRQDKSKYQESAKKVLLGNIIITRYNNKNYRIDDIYFDQNPLSEFETSSGSISYVDYYHKHHNINIKDIKQPLLLSLKKQRGSETLIAEDIRFCLVPELCYLTGIRDEIRADNRLMREIATITRVSPNQRMVALEKFYNNVSKTRAAREILEKWGLSLLNTHNSLLGRIMDLENIYFAKNIVCAGQKAEFSKDALNNEILNIVHMRNWILIHFKNDSRAVKALIDNMDRCCNAFGMHVSKPKIISLDKDRADFFVNALRRNINKDSQIVVCICPNSREDRYSAIKKICCSELPIPSQVINARTLFNETKNRSIVQKIILQMNCKMGGSLWRVKIPFKNVMICGIDSYHDPSQKGISVAAFVSSMDSSYTQWYSKAVLQTKREEIVNGLTSSFEAALRYYKIRNGYFPESVVIYRDGVGDGQLNLCANYEIPQFDAVCSNHINITYIIVQKRVNTRFFLENKLNFDNPLPGTVVDKYITRRKMFDFFLVSQNVGQGTVSPTHFVILRDDANYGPDIIQKLSYKLCFLYYNWPGTVRVPACCMYAHKMAYLIGQNVQRDTAESLLDKLFYL
ncbi:protein argonaute-3 [Scaptodrosophila lebanonensis]|uniref:Protein argonaute-3 n=1 Tax=Drosophila lebanonensis TaxID=7225 RepID=A0A6J2U2D7_DROLE|nr:protein argonaute-3 [Scaptodrosophila lebanonensis]